MEADLDRRVREALETPPLEQRRRQQKQQHQNQRTFDDLERLNAHVQFDLSKDEKEIRQRRWKVVQAKRHMKKFMMTSKDNITFEKLDREAAQIKMELLLSGDNGGSGLDSFDDDMEFPTFGLGFDSNTPMVAMSRIKSQEHYAKIVNKALTSFSSLTDHERNEFFYAFTRNGFRDALRTGKLPDGSDLNSIGNGKYIDKFGIIRDQHGPFWPRDYGPLFPAPNHKKPVVQAPELLMQCLDGK